MYLLPKKTIGFLLLFVSLLAGCDPAFDPLLENDQLHFSIYGTLDATLDTQRVRVGPVRPSVLTPPDPIDATVTLEHLGSGEISSLKDSLYSYGEDAWAWNYLTDMEIQPGESYKIVAERSDGHFSYATSTIPSDFPNPHYLDRCGSNGLSIVQFYIEGVDRLVVFNVTYYYRSGGNPNEKFQFISYLDDVRVLSDGRLYVVINFIEALRRLAENLGLEGSVSPHRYEVFMVSAGPDWPVTEGVSLEEITIPGESRNVENGVGVLAGIVSKRFEITHNCDE